MSTTKVALMATAAALYMAPASAQKAQDTLRIAINNPFAVLSNYDLPVDESTNFTRDVYDHLIYFDERAQKFVPGLAKSWTRIDDKTIEYEIRSDIKFHNGDALDAGDIKATIDYSIDPKSKITFVANYNWVREVELLGPYKLRIRSHDVQSTDLAHMSYRFQIFNGKLLDKMADKADYGRLNPVGSGVYKVTQLDPNKGISVERYDGYNTTPERKKAAIKRIHGIPMPDKQTQAAQMMVGGVDILRNVEPELAKALAADPNTEITYIPELNLFYFALDSQNLSGNKALSDIRVRKAIFMGINADEIIKHIVPGGHVAEKLYADCFKATTACKYNVKPPAYDPAGAKKLLAEAGYPDGIDLHYVVYAANKNIGEAVAGELHKIGVRVTVQATDISLYRRMLGDGKLQAWSILYPTGTFPDASGIMNVLFTGPAMKYYNDPVIAKATEDGVREFDPAKRADIYAKAFDRINEMAYHFPLSSVPTVYVHSKDVAIKEDPFSAGQTFVSDYIWK
jgi:peptide/nickel transport system substrate-binding protein